MKTIDGYTRLQFANYLRHTLIPDFHAADMHATATDFETAVSFITGDGIEVIDLEAKNAELRQALREAVGYIKVGFPEIEDDDKSITTSADDGPEATFHYAAALKLLKP